MREFYNGMLAVFGLNVEQKARLIRCLAAFFNHSVTHEDLYADKNIVLQYYLQKAEFLAIEISIGAGGTPIFTPSVLMDKIRDASIMDEQDVLNHYCGLKAFLGNGVFPDPSCTMKTGNIMAASIGHMQDKVRELGYTATIGYKGFPLFKEVEKANNEYVGGLNLAH